MKRLYIFEALKRLTFLNTKRLYIYNLWMFSLLVFRNVSSRILVIKNYRKKDWTLSNYEFPNCHCKQVMNNTTYVIGPKSIVGALQVKLMFPRRTGRPLSVTLWETKQLVSSQNGKRIIFPAITRNGIIEIRAFGTIILSLDHWLWKRNT